MSNSTGSEWRKWDLHFHTPSSFDYKGTATDEAIVEGLKAAGVSAVVITDHHKIDVDRIKRLQQLAGSALAVFPGIELRSELGGSTSVHFIGIFDPQSDIYVEVALPRCDVITREELCWVFLPTCGHKLYLAPFGSCLRNGFFRERFTRGKMEKGKNGKVSVRHLVDSTGVEAVTF